MAQLGIASTGTALLMIAGYIDLSIGSLLSLAAVVSAVARPPRVRRWPGCWAS